jgi:hypothetical protein
MNSFGPHIPSIRLGYAPPDHSSNTLDRNHLSGNTTSNILEDSGTEQMDFGYIARAEPPMLESEQAYLDNGYNPAI